MNKKLIVAYGAVLLLAFAGGFAGAYAERFMSPPQALPEYFSMEAVITAVDTRKNQVSVQLRNGTGRASIMTITPQTKLLERKLRASADGIVYGFEDTPREFLAALIPGSPVHILGALNPDTGRIELIRVVTGESL